MRRTIPAVSAVIVFLANFVYGYGIRWFVDAGYVNYSNTTTRLDGDTDSSVGCFAQLLWVGPNNTVDPAYAGAAGLDGTEGPLSDDVVVGWRWVGAGAALGEDGWFSDGEAWDGGNIVSGRYYYARVWSAPASDYANGYVPVSLTNLYGNSPTFYYQRSNPVLDDFDIVASGDVNTTQYPLAIPEPGVVTLGLLGAFLTRAIRRRSVA